MAYKIIHEQFWTDPKIRNLKMEDKFLFLYLITNPHSHFTGIYYLPKKIITLDTGIDRGIDRGIKELSDRKLISYDNEIEIIFIKKMLKYQSNNQNYNENQKKGIAKHLLKLHNSILVKEFLDFYKDLNIPYNYTPIDRGIDTPPSTDTDTDTDTDTVSDTAKKGIVKGKQNESFEIFWEAYPKRKSKGQAEKAWEKIKPDKNLIEIILNKIRIAKESEDWQKESGQYIPYPATWLNVKGWEDEYIKHDNRMSETTKQNLLVAQQWLQKGEKKDDGK